MEAFATYDPSASDLVNFANFWAEVDEIVSLPHYYDGNSSGTFIVDANLLKSRLTAFYALCDACYDIHLDHSGTSEEVLTKLLDSPLIHSFSSVAIANIMIDLVTLAKSFPTLQLLFESILFLGSRFPEIYKSKLAVSQLTPRLVHHFWAARYAEEVLIRESNHKESNGIQGGISLDWNIRHVRNVSMGDIQKQKQQLRDRRLQCKLRDESIILLYEVCRAQRMELKDMRAIDASFVNHLFNLVEASRHYNDDSYNHQLIKLIIALNEQFMVAGIDDASQRGKAGKTSAAHANIVMTVLRTRLNASNTFAENLIWMLNRASSLNAEDVCMQLLVLKLLYLIFTTKETSHYFYLNDLKVLVDVFVRELHDLPEDSETLRHTYLRVLHPLLTNTQLLTYPYKRKEIQRLLENLISRAHLRDISTTTKRLVDRCLNAEWSTDLDLDGDTYSKIGAYGDEKIRTLTVQSVSGGQKTLIQTQTRKDSEGVTIPLDTHQESIRGPTTSTMAIAAAVTQEKQGPSESLTQLVVPRIVGTSEDNVEDDSNHHRPKDKRSNSVGGMSPTKQVKLVLHADLINARELATPRRDLITNPSTLSVRRDLGQRASSAQSAAVTRHSHASYDYRNHGEDRWDSDEGDTSTWSNGSASNSWQFGMAGDYPSESPLKRLDRREEGHLSSPLSVEYVESSQVLTASPTQDSSGHWSKPEVRVQQIVGNGDSVSTVLFERSGIGSGSSSVAGDSTTSRRRKPPAPPSSSDGDQVNRRARRAYLSSTSETNLPSTVVRHSHNGSCANLQKSIAMDLNLLPDSPISESVLSSREPSPTFDGGLITRRRRPPPPPINRTTKGVKAASQQIQLATEKAAAQRTQQSQDYISENNDEETNDHPHLEQAMKYLYVSDEGYGW